ncbi:unnamed protein product [Prorocentrum cordatum]|uniref:Uncharacterized protein n=1 Tax=Prorocentrum cordatum TaxID=2364126 RepID=A0ABN9WH74_9DINO|nr:unnamed protein product [Polarella glacialis]
MASSASSVTARAGAPPSPAADGAAAGASPRWSPLDMATPCCSRSDGTAVACGSNSGGQCGLPALAEGLSFTQVAARKFRNVLLRSDGTAAACGWNFRGPCDLPAPAEGLSFTQVATGFYHTVLLQSDGTAVACGSNAQGQCDFPAQAESLSFTQVAAGGDHTVLLQSDGTAVACGSNEKGQCDLPAPAEGLSFTQVAAGNCHTVLLQSDGTAVACGSNEQGQCDLPAPAEGLSYVAHLVPTLLLQAFVDGESLCFTTLGGVERYRFEAALDARLANIHEQLTATHRVDRPGLPLARVDAVLLGRLLSDATAEETVASAFGLDPR